MFCAGISLLIKYLVLEYLYGLNVLYWNIPTDQVFGTGISLRAECFVLAPSLLTEYFVLEYLLWLNIYLVLARSY